MVPLFSMVIHNTLDYSYMKSCLKEGFLETETGSLSCFYGLLFGNSYCIIETKSFR